MSSSEIPIRVALVGYGYASRTFHAPLLQAAGLRLVAVVSRDAAKVQADWPEVEVVSDLNQALQADVELVVIATPNDTHFELARAALRVGKHVVVDKPFTVSLEEAEQLQPAPGQLLAVFHNRRWDGDFLTIRRLLAQGTLGQLAHFESRFDRYRPLLRDRWRERPGPGSGVWYDLGPHLVDQACQLFGPPQSIYADLASFRGGAVDDFHVLLDYPGLRVVLRAGTLMAAETPRFTLHGRSGSYQKFGLDPQEARLLGGDVRAERPGVLTGPDGSSHEVPDDLGDYAEFYRRLSRAIREAGPNPVPASEAMLVMRILELGETSARTGKKIKF